MCSASCHLSVVKSLPLYTYLSGSSPITLYVNSDLRKTEISSNISYTVTIKDKKKNQQAHS